MGSRNYSTSVDIWSVGCIFAELLNGKPLYQGNSNSDQLKKIFKMMGTPNEEIWPGVVQLPEFKRYDPEPGVNLRDVIPRLDDEGYDLITVLFI